MANLLYNLAQPFSDTKQYTQGVIVIYNDRMYEMTADEYTPGPFDPEKFTERFLSEMISGKLNSNLTSEPELIYNKSSTNNPSYTYTATKNGYALIVMLSCGQPLYCDYKTYSHVKLNDIKVEEYLITSKQHSTSGWKVYLVPVKQNDVVYALAQGPASATERRLIIYQI